MISVLGSGAFGTALAISLSQNGPVTLWSRDGEQVRAMRETRENAKRLPGASLPDAITITADLDAACRAQTILLALPMQRTAAFLAEHAQLLKGKTLVSCSKGIDLETGKGPTALMAALVPQARAAILTGPSFAADIGRGLPTALTLACADGAEALQAELSTPSLRLYRSADTIGAELGGALKNVIAIGAGVVMGAGMGDSARAALMTRGFAEMNRLAVARGARPETLSGLAGFGDLVLTCTSSQSRNFRHGFALGAGETIDQTVTVEGVATAHAVARMAEHGGIEMPIAVMIAALCDNRMTVAQATLALLSRPLKEE
ncbi:NAD(P)H-dependent glycerol-3-phosphate dehydrogenase [Thioclava sp. GXIMD4216]|uniref:Glycerol-3-phosphate dehydrogenase [NAD(P)+] n=1 Tax=Thioclava litoralis TaxID=3076557 RepID=A0ABZ1E2A6_9RHOB|nr:NAD(P)H-dependent glycerol-3-phosphate dehydrogenase [Thioclava sp. FTW29]